MKRFADKVVLVTGAASGIGAAVVDRIAQEGGKLVCVDIQLEPTQKKAEEVCAEGGEALAMACDVSDASAVREVVEQAIAHFGRLDGLCNSAGILRFENTLDIALEDWQQVLAVNLTGTFLMCQAALPHLLENGGAIANIASSSALMGQPWSAAYAASKGGVVSFTKTLAIEFGRKGVRSNSVCPGGIDTPIQKAFRFPEGADQSLLKRILPFNGMKSPDSVASTVAYLLSEDADHVNGVELRVDGGTLS
jgi:meso-butanediol dehydrogenase/(S,S)-butanediol dehydrogenase/diacetyl reductase